MSVGGVQRAIPSVGANENTFSVVGSAVHRCLVLKNGDSIVAYADILPECPSAEQTFPNVAQFSR